MTETASATDMELGLALVFGLIGLGGAVVMYAAAVGENQVLSAWGFAAAMLAGALAIAALHVYDRP
ncbi:hypothetical protein ACFQPA_07610 [Halomarina halobia]|uniref:Major facilitator superfamily (MFS) profile domain-containing protein n=1 Tax=Halomarina halobia TaxID=3033386 RepID=A0ABD6ACW2_9EURY|nr:MULTISPECIES: hypothetical protein [unclassified Halomarina]